MNVAAILQLILSLFGNSPELTQMLAEILAIFGQLQAKGFTEAQAHAKISAAAKAVLQ